MTTQTETTTIARPDTHGALNPAHDVININGISMHAAIAAYSEEEQDLLTWLWGYAHDELCGKWTPLEQAVGYDKTVLYKVFNGSYQASLSNICEAIRRLKKAVLSGRTKLIKTIVTERIMQALDYAKDNSAMIAITGPTGRGKTCTAKYWAAANNHGISRYLRMQSSGTRRSLVMSLCKSCGIGTSGTKTAALELRLQKMLDWRNVLIIDEAGHLMPKSGSGTGAIEFLRDLHDNCGCAVVLIFTDVYLAELHNGKLATYFEQFVGRIEFEEKIPTEVRRDEVKAIVKAFIPTPSVKMVELALKIARNRDGKLRTLCKDIQRAKAFAESENRNMTEKDLKLASDWRLSGGVWPDDEQE